MRLRLVPIALGLLAAFGAAAATTNELSDAEIQGRQLAQQLLQQWPATNLTQAGVLKIRDANKQRHEIPIKCEVRVTGTNWSSIYEATFTNRVEVLLIVHAAGRPNQYFYDPQFPGDLCFPGNASMSGHRFRIQPAGVDAMVPFAGSDFQVADFGLEFFHWPQQKVLKKEVKRSRGCTVLESTNPDPSTNGYARVVSWIDSESGGIVQAWAYDANNKLVKEFYPKDFKKVNGQWQVQEMEIDNDQTGSRTRLDFDLKKE